LSALEFVTDAELGHAELLGLLIEIIGTGSGGEANDFHTVRNLTGHRKGARSDGASRAENDDAFLIHG